MIRSACRALTAALFLSLLVASAASAAEPHTLDGVPTDATAAQAAADAGGGGCAAAPDLDGTVPCFTTDAAHAAATRSALRAGHLPPGYRSMPTGRLRERLEAPTPATAVAARAGHHGLHAHAAACYGLADDHVYTDANFGGSTGWFGTSGSWTAFSSTFNESISSYKHGDFLYTYYNEYSTGSGATYYGGADPCSTAFNLGTGNPPWNDEFSAYKVFSA